MAMAKAFVSRMGMGIGIGNINLAFRNSIRRCRHTKTKGHFSYAEKELESEEGLKAMFERWQVHYGEGKDWCPEEKAYRFNVFNKSAKFVDEFNKQGHSFTVCLNAFSVIEYDEFMRTRTGEFPSWSAPTEFYQGYEYDAAAKGATSKSTS